MPTTNELLQEGRYRVSQPLSQDGTVFEAYDTVRNTTVLVREFPVRLNKVATVSQRESIKLAFATQAKALSEIDHHSLLHVQDYFAEIDRQYLVMESVEGEDLYDLVKRNKRPFSVAEVLTWADELLDALDYLHSRKPAVVHRNLRPQYLRIDGSGKLKLLSGGLDTRVEGDLSAPQAETEDLRYSPMEQIWPGLDAASQKVITNTYDERSERILKEPLDARSDIYSLGATLYFLVTGHEPVDPLERSIDILEGKIDPLREPTKLDDRIPPEISDVLMKALEIKRENRYDSALIMRQVLKSAIARVAERDADAVEQAEAAEIIRQASQAKLDEQARNQKAEEARRLEEQRLQQEREAEQQRVLAEQRAEADRLAAEQAEAARLAAEQAAEKLAAEKAEAERLAAEKAAAEKARVEAQRAEAARLEAERVKAERDAERLRTEQAAREAKAEAPSDDDSVLANPMLLEIPSSPEVMAYRDSAPNVDENELAAVLAEIEQAERQAGKSDEEKIEASAEPNVAEEAAADVRPVQVFDHAVDAAPATDDVDDEHDLFMGTKASGSSLPIPAIAGAIGLVVVLAVGAWYAMSGSSEPAAQPAPAQVQVAEPTQPEPSPTVDTIASTASETNTSAAVATPTEQQPAAKPKKAEPKKEPEKKKAVTVDDLINDN